MKRSQFRRLMDILLRTLGRQTRRTIAQYGVPVTDTQRVEVAQALLPHIQRARLQSHALGVQLLEAEADRMDVEVPPIQPPRPYERQAVVTLLENVTRVERPRRTGSSVTVTDSNDIPDDAPRVSVTVLDPVTKRSSRATVEVTDDNRHDPEVVKVITKKATGVVERHARMASREVVIDSVEAVEYDDDEPGDVIGWARVLTGEESCPFCMMLASRGPVYPSEEAAQFISTRSRRYDARDPKLFHDWCDCKMVMVVEGRDWEGQEQYLALERFWMDVTEKLAPGEDSLGKFMEAAKERIAAGDVAEFFPSTD